MLVLTRKVHQSIVIGDDIDKPARFVPSGASALPTCRVPDPYGGRDSLRLLYRMAHYNRSRAIRLKTQHLRKLAEKFRCLIFLVSLPISGYVARVADRDGVKIRRVAE